MSRASAVSAVVIPQVKSSARNITSHVETPSADCGTVFHIHFNFHPSTTATFVMSVSNKEADLDHEKEAETPTGELR